MGMEYSYFEYMRVVIFYGSVQCKATIIYVFQDVKRKHTYKENII